MSTLLDVTAQEWTKGEEGTRWPLSIHSNALANSIIVKTGPGKLYGFAVYTSNATAQFVLVLDAAAVPVDGFVPCFPFTVSSSAPLYVSYGDTGRCFDTGIVLCNSSTAVTKTIGSADCWFDAQYLQPTMPSVTGNSAQNVLTATVTLSDAQTKALPTAGVQVVAAPGANKALIVLGTVWRLDATHGAYSNFSNFRAELDYGATGTFASSAYVESAQGAFADASSIHLLGMEQAYSGGSTWFADVAIAADVAVVLNGTNGVAGNLTGGNAANTLRVTAWYMVLGV